LGACRKSGNAGQCSLIREVSQPGERIVQTILGTIRTNMPANCKGFKEILVNYSKKADEDLRKL
jgi:hypothetical protein